MHLKADNLAPLSSLRSSFDCLCTSLHKRKNNSKKILVEQSFHPDSLSKANRAGQRAVFLTKLHSSAHFQNRKIIQYYYEQNHVLLHKRKYATKYWTVSLFTFLYFYMPFSVTLWSCIQRTWRTVTGLKG